MQLGAMETTVEMPRAKSTADLVEEAALQRAISNYFKTHDHDLCAHIVDPLKKKLEESSGEQLERTMKHVRDSADMEKFTQSLITDLLKEALQAKQQSDSGEEQEKSKNSSKAHLYTAVAGLISTVTGILVTYFLSQN